MPDRLPATLPQPNTLNQPPAPDLLLLLLLLHGQQPRQHALSAPASAVSDVDGCAASTSLAAVVLLPSSG
jgi:hypothetical protein